MASPASSGASPELTAKPVGPVRIAVASDGGAAYAMFDVERVDVTSARLIGPLLLEVGEEVTLRVERGGQQADVRARVVSHERRGHDAPVTVFAFDEGESLASLVD